MKTNAKNIVDNALHQLAKVEKPPAKPNKKQAQRLALLKQEHVTFNAGMAFAPVE